MCVSVCVCVYHSCQAAPPNTRAILWLRGASPGLGPAMKTLRGSAQEGAGEVCPTSVKAQHHVCMCVCVCVCIYREGGREREREGEREKEREKEREGG